MTPHRIDQLAETVFNEAFHALDLEPDLNGQDAGAIATMTEAAFRAAVQQVLTHDTADLPF